MGKLAHLSWHQTFRKLPDNMVFAQMLLYISP